MADQTKDYELTALRSLALRWNKGASKYCAGSEFVDNPERVFECLEHRAEMKAKLAARKMEIAKDAEIAQLRSENDQWRTWGIVEIAVRNPNAASYMEHWEGRATKAEAENAALRERVAALEALASKWATNAPLSERRTLHEASLAYRKAAGIFPNPDGVKAILDK